MKKLFSFAKSFLVAPSAAADACAAPDAWKDALKIYAALAVLQLVSSWFDPLAFLDPNSPIRPAHGAGFWTAVLMWEPALMAMSVFFTVLVVDWMSEGWLPVKTAVATLWSALPAVTAVYYASPNTTLGKGWFVGLLAAWLAASVAAARRVPADRWRLIGTYLLGLSAVQIAGLAVEFLVVVPARSLTAFYIYSGVMLLWVVASFSIGMRRLKITGSIARTALAFVFALLVSSVFPAVAYLLGLMPKEVLKVVLYV